MPFIAVLTNPEIVENNFLLQFIYENQRFLVLKILKFIIFSRFLVFFVLINSFTFKSLTIFAQLRFAQMREHSIGKRLLRDI